MAPTADTRLQRLLGGPMLAALRQRLRRHFERGGSADVTLQLGGLQPVEREALALISGQPVSAARSLRWDLAEVEARLQAAGIADSLRGALEQIDGPIANLAVERAHAKAAWEDVEASPRRDLRLQAWLRAAGNLGVVKRLAKQDAARAIHLLAQADAVLEHLPAGGLPRAQLAALTLGDAHGLDAGRPVATLVLATWRHAEATATAAIPLREDLPEEASQASGEERLRDIWSRAGVLVNELARPVLVLNLHRPSHPIQGPWEPGEPAYLSLRWLLRNAPVWPVQGRRVYVCENPNLLAIAAEQLGTRCAPLVCTDGMPAAAQRTLLDQLAHAGAQLFCRADFDAAGIHIANLLLRRSVAVPWRMGADDYEAAVQAAGARHALGEGLPSALWDARLASVMHHHGMAIAEEAMAEKLMEDLDEENQPMHRNR